MPNRRKFLLTLAAAVFGMGLVAASVIADEFFGVITKVSTLKPRRSPSSKRTKTRKSCSRPTRTPSTSRRMEPSRSTRRSMRSWKRASRKPKMPERRESSPRSTTRRKSSRRSRKKVGGRKPRIKHQDHCSLGGQGRPPTISAPRLTEHDEATKLVQPIRNRPILSPLGEISFAALLGRHLHGSCRSCQHAGQTCRSLRELHPPARRPLSGLLN